jgi:hypothetical protein
MAADLAVRGSTTQGVESALIEGDLGKLSDADRVAYYLKVCESLGLNPLTKPFDYLRLNGKLILYARKDCTEQLRSLRNITVDRVDFAFNEGLVIVTTYLRTPAGRVDSAIGAVAIQGLQGEARANALMKAETKSKRRATLSIAGLGILDESEIETIPGAQVESMSVRETATGGRLLTMHEPAPADELARLREEIATWHEHRPLLVGSVEAKKGPWQDWDLEISRKALEWFHAQRKAEEQEAAQQAQARQAAEIGEAIDPKSPALLERAIADARALVADITANAAKGRPGAGDYDRMRAALIDIQGLDGWEGDKDPNTIAKDEILPYLKARLAGYEEEAIEGTAMTAEEGADAHRPF